MVLVFKAQGWQLCYHDMRHDKTLHVTWLLTFTMNGSCHCPNCLNDTSFGNSPLSPSDMEELSLSLLPSTSTLWIECDDDDEAFRHSTSSQRTGTSCLIASYSLNTPSKAWTLLMWVASKDCMLWSWVQSLLRTVGRRLKMVGFQMLMDQR